MKTALIAALTAVIACGGATKSDSTAPVEPARSGQNHDMVHRGHGEGEHMGGEADEVAHMPPEIAKFHATLAPRWHAPRGPQRMTDTCGAIAELRGEAAAVAAAAAPGGGDAAAWSAGGQQLVAAVNALDAACKASDAAAFESAFGQVHERFHAVLAAAGGDHEHGEADHDDHHP
jgi:hypothetical protein